jgi:hypothetical protein
MLIRPEAFEFILLAHFGNTMPHHVTIPTIGIHSQL